MLDRIDIGSRLHARYWDGQFYAAVVTAVSESKRRAKAPVKVNYLGYGSESDAWLSVVDLKSKTLRQSKEDASLAAQVALLERGVKLQAKSTDGVWYSAEVVRISQKKGCAVKVNFLGYTADSDEWVTVDCVRSKLLRLQRSPAEVGSAPKRTPRKKHSSPTKLSKPSQVSDVALAGDLSEMPIKMSGAVVCSVSVSPHMLVREVKEQIFAKLGIPVECQVLVADPVALMDDDANLGDLSASPSMEVVEAQDSGESVMARLQNLLQPAIDSGKMLYSGKKGELTFFNIDLLEDTADEAVMGLGWREDSQSDDHKNFSSKAEIAENDLRLWFSEGDLPEFAPDALRLLNEQGRNGGGCFTFSKPDPWGLEGYVVGMGAVIRAGCIVGWEQNGVTWA